MEMSVVYFVKCCGLSLFQKFTILNQITFGDFCGDSELCRVSSGWITSPSLSEFGCS